MPSAASAALLGTYTPPNGPNTGDNDLNDLDHHLMYAWKIADAGLAGQTVTSATLTFTNMYNWNTDTNKLFIDLLDTATNKGVKVNGSYSSAAVQGWGDFSGTTQNGVTYFTDDPNSGNNNVILRDDFTNFGDTGSTDPFKDAKGWLVPDNTSTTVLTSKEFLGPGQKYQGSVNLGGEVDPAGWTHSAIDSNGYYDYTYTFSQAGVDALNAYMASGNDFALGLDPDCHFYNTGVTLNLYQDTFGGQAAVPEPASLLLLGTGLAYAGRRYRSKKRR